MTTRRQVLQEALTAVEGRGRSYGPPAPFFARVARDWSIELGVSVTAAQVVRCMIRLKLARDAVSASGIPDSAVDIAGYAACLGELQSVEAMNDG